MKLRAVFTRVMTRGRLPALILSTLVSSGCDNPAKQAAAEAELCAEAQRLGLLEQADTACSNAVLGVAEDVLEPDVRAARLFKLAKIKRQRGNYPQAEELLDQSIAIQATLPGSSGPLLGEMYVELALSLAGQDKWAEGAVVLEKAMPFAETLGEAARATAGNVFKHYARRLRAVEQQQLAERFEAKAAMLREQPDSEKRNPSN